MKTNKKCLTLLSIALVSLTGVAVAGSGAKLFPILGSESSWWDNGCAMPTDYTSIGDIITTGVKGNTYTTRGTVTYIEDDSFYIQSRNKGICVYKPTETIDVQVGNVVDVEGTFSPYNGLNELTKGKVTLYSETNPNPVVPVVIEAEDYLSVAADYNGVLCKVKNLSFTSASYTTKRVTLYFNSGTITAYFTCNNSLVAGHAVENLALENTDKLFNFTGVVGAYNATMQLRANSDNCFELVEGGSGKTDDDDDPPVITTGGTVIESPTQTGDILGPLYIPAEGEKPTVSYQEMVASYGDSIFIDYGNFEMLIDGGADEDTNNVMNRLATYVDDHQLEVLILTHPHVDHFGGIDKLTSWLNQGKISNIKYIIDYGGYDSAASRYMDVRNYYVGEGATYYSIYEMMHNSESGYPNVLKITDDMSMKFLDTGMYYPAGQQYPSGNNDNDNSVASVLSIGNTRYFLCGDITNEGNGHGNVESTLIANYGDTGLWTADTYNIVKANHHGSSQHGSNSTTWVNGTKPDIVVASAAMVANNRGTTGPTASQHPHEQAVDRYTAYTSNFYANMINGTITFTHNNFTDNPVMSGEGRTINYYDNSGNIVDPQSEKLTKYKDSIFFQICPKYGA